MTRPAVIVGLGGTGQWVLTYLKRELKIAGMGELPTNTRLLAFDTLPLPEAAVRTTQGQAEAAVRTAQGQEQIQLGSVQLSGEEFIHIGGNAYAISQRLANQDRDREYDHIAKWFRNREWRGILPPAAWNLDDGAGRIRQLGRLAIFKDMLNLDAGSRVWRSLKRAIDNVKSQGQFSENQPLELILTGSFAGGTGSGCFLDIAVLMRHLARDIPHSLRAYFVLPTAFNSEPKPEMLARSFAAWRELNRFMLVNPDFPIRIDYSSENSQFQIVLDKRLFDVCYLVDGYRGNNRLNTDPKYSIFPTISEAIATLLDEAGTEFVRTITTNLLPVYQERPSEPLYSGLGSYSFKVPAFFLQQERSHRFAIHLLNVLLARTSSVVPQSGSTSGTGSELVRLLTAIDQNLEKGVGLPGRREVDSFLAVSALRYKDVTINPTTFTAKIGYIYREGGSTSEALIEQHASAVLNPTRNIKREDPSWLRPFTDLGDDPNFQSLREEVGRELAISVVKDYGKRQGDRPQQAIKRLGNLRDYVFSHYGGDSSSGEVDGSFGDILLQVQRFNLDLFAQMIRVWTLATLMGISPDSAIKARGGKLGYAFDFFDGLVVCLEDVRVFLEQVQIKRETLRPRLRLEGLAQTAQRIAEQTSATKFFWIFDHPRFEQDLNAFLQAQQRLIELRKEELLHKYVVRSIEGMQQLVLKARAEIERWIWHLADGDAATGTVGLGDGLRRSLELSQANFGVDRLLSGDPRSERPGVQQILHDESLLQVDVQEIERTLARIEWNAEMRGDQLALQVAFQPVVEGDLLQVLNSPAAAKSDEERIYFGVQNQQMLLELSVRTTLRPLQNLNVAEAIMAAYPDPQRLAADVLKARAEPLVNVTRTDVPKRSAILRVGYMQNEATRSYFQKVEEHLRAVHQVGNQDDAFFIKVINSENLYTCALIRTDELFRFNRFVSWGKCQEGFDKYVTDMNQDPMLIHNFAAEANAARYERRLAQERGRRALHPWVVMLLEEETRLKLAIFCVLLGFFSPDDLGDGVIWKFQLPLPRNNIRDFILSPKGNEEEVLFQSLYNFVIRGRDIRPDHNQFVIWPLRPDEPNLVALAVKRRQEELGRQQEIEFWKKQLDRFNPKTFGAWLRQKALGSAASSDTIVRQEFDDLATLIDLMLQDRINELGEDDPLQGVNPRAPRTGKWQADN